MDLREALEAVDRNRYVAGVKQSSSLEVVTRLLQRLNVRPGDRILEIGTGAGYSTALLKLMTGREGKVATIDVNAGMLRRAQGLWASDDIEVTALSADARKQLPRPLLGERYDRVVAWTTLERVPRSWVAIATTGARMVLPVQLAPVAGAVAVAVMDRTRAGLLGVGLEPGAFVPAHPGPAPQALGIPTHVDARNEDGSIWISAPWLRSSGRAARAILVRLARGRLRAARPVLRPGEDAGALASWLYTQPTPRGLTTAQLSGTRLVGASCPGEVFLLSHSAERGQGQVIAAGSGATAARQVCAWVTAWRESGSPGLGDLVPHADWTAEGWAVGIRRPGRSRE